MIIYTFGLQALLLLSDCLCSSCTYEIYGHWKVLFIFSALDCFKFLIINCTKEKYFFVYLTSSQGKKLEAWTLYIIGSFLVQNDIYKTK